MSLLDAAAAVVEALAVEINISNLCAFAVKNAGNFFESRATTEEVSCDSIFLRPKATYRVST